MSGGLEGNFKKYKSQVNINQTVSAQVAIRQLHIGEAPLHNKEHSTV